MLKEYFYTFLWSITPLVELRASIPLGYLNYGLSIYEATIISILGSIVTTSIVLFILPYIVEFLEKHSPFFDKIMKKIFEKTRTKHSKKMAIIGELFLIMFVAIPLPGSGGWTGVLIAYLFKIPYKTAIFLISVGITLSGVIVALLTLFGKDMWDFFIATA